MRSMMVRKPWIVGAIVKGKGNYGQYATSSALAVVNNWLKEGAFKLRFLSYFYPASVETPTLDRRHFYGSYPPGLYLPVYLLFKALDLTFVPNIYEKRGTQLLLVVFYNYLLHFLLVLTLCGVAFLVSRSVGFDRLNSGLFAVVPAVVQFHNAQSLYCHHLPYFHDTAVLPLFALFVFCELMRITGTSCSVSRILRIAQPFLMFYGTLVSWVFVFVIATVYFVRVIRKEIEIPVSFTRVLHWVKQSFLFFAPAMIAIVVYVGQLIYYSVSIAHSSLFDIRLSSQRFTLMENLLFRLGFADGIDRIFFYAKEALYTQVHTGYGISGMVLLYTVFYLVIRNYKSMLKDGSTNNLATTTYIMFFVPALGYSVVFLHSNAIHTISALVFSSALSLSFVFWPTLILQVTQKDTRYLCGGDTTGKFRITLAALLGLGSAIVYGYTQIYDKEPVTKLFSSPAYVYTVVGNFIRKNTTYQDVVFHDGDFLSHKTDHNKIHFSNKIIHYANTPTHIYQKVKDIKQDFTIKVFYFETQKDVMQQMATFLKSHNIDVEILREEKIGRLLVFDGEEFRTWYEHAHAL